MLPPPQPLPSGHLTAILSQRVSLISGEAHTLSLATLDPGYEVYIQLLDFKSEMMTVPAVHKIGHLLLSDYCFGDFIINTFLAYRCSIWPLSLLHLKQVFCSQKSILKKINK